ncbi:phage terminase large subunit family protein [Epibacterium sp. MM17-32]|uniref:phage terminase large subunit family protein n=1 Tax=Epibacterium sp. MM17-32 TaxID=2917734 RepID=UPI001EF69845|nr:phage terminase large subunit family protein [Epibacterium sp. MM17-32]MCG7629003.1 phage terminase large subunit family protein [Epibacterium sp. MM17-32]
MSNSYIEELYRRAEARFNVDAEDMSLGDWVCANTHLRGRPFDFSRYPFQKQICDDLHPNIDVIKPSQIGLTEVQIRKSLGFIARNRGTTLIFTFPTEKMFKKQSVTRIKPLVEEEKAFNLETRTGEKPTRSMGLYQVGSSFMHVTNATEGDATSISADAVFNDEVDLTDQQMLALFNSRLQNSDFKINQRFSTPTFSNFGIDKGFQVSDQHEYLCKCAACNHWNAPIFRPQFIHIPGLSSDINDLVEIDEQMIDDGKIDIMNSYVKCEKCHAPLDLGNTELREWVPRYASRTHHRGYRVSPFSTDRLPPEYVITQLLRYKSRDYIRGWWNTVCGEAFTDGNSRLSDADIERCFTGQMSIPAVDASAPTWIGVDMGQTCHIVVAQGSSAEDLHIVRFAEVPIKELNDFIKDMLATYNVIGGAVDRFPYTPNADDLWELSDGRILPVEYRGQKSVNLVKDQVTEDIIYAQANRTQAIDAVAAAVRRKRWRFSGYGNQKSIITDHLKDMVRDENPEVEAKWVKLTGSDHFFHALAFLGLAVRLKETERGLFSDPRTTVAVVGASVQSLNTNLIGKTQKAGGLLR